MTEQQWLVNLDPLEVLHNMRDKPSGRKLRLAAVSCCRRMAHLTTDERSVRAVDAAERYADKLLSAATTFEIEQRASDVVDPSRPVGVDPGNDAAHCAALCLALWAPADWSTQQVFRWSATILERKEQVNILACVFGIPHSRRRVQIRVNPAWRTSTVVALATGIYEERAFDRLPILADALQDAGCDSDDVLHHCRDAKATHVRGCWVVDLVLGKS